MEGCRSICSRQKRRLRKRIAEALVEREVKMKRLEIGCEVETSSAMVEFKEDGEDTENYKHDGADVEQHYYNLEDGDRWC